jgi:two-component system NtrC family sensor kinase
MNKSVDHSFALLLRLNRVNNQDHFLRGFSHLINNPIGSIHLACRLLKGYTQGVKTLLDELNDGPEQIPDGFREDVLIAIGDIPQAIQGISDSAERLNQLASYLAGFSGSGAIPTGIHGVNLNKLITLCITMADHVICKRSKNLSLDLSPDLPILSANEQQVSQVIFNLLINALLSLPDRSAIVVISTSYNHATGCVRMMVMDEGTGIQPEIFERIMEPFFSTWAEHGCIGLGLTVSNQIICNHGGELKIDSGPGRGTQVIVSLPVNGIV